jgi:hypothetical protein
MTKRLRWILISAPVLIITIAALIVLSVKQGETDPKTIQQKASDEVAKTVAAIAPVTQGKVTSSQWSTCSQETPGVHRYSYEYSVDLNASGADPASVVSRIRQYWTSHQYGTVFQDGDQVDANLPNEKLNWSAKTGLDESHMPFLTVNVDCVTTSSDPTKK